MRDRHLDQLLMCAVYVIAKVNLSKSMYAALNNLKSLSEDLRKGGEKTNAYRPNRFLLVLLRLHKTTRHFRTSCVVIGRSHKLRAM